MNDDGVKKLDILNIFEKSTRIYVDYEESMKRLFFSPPFHTKFVIFGENSIQTDIDFLEKFGSIGFPIREETKELLSKIKKQKEYLRKGAILCQKMWKEECHFLFCLSAVLFHRKVYFTEGHFNESITRENLWEEGNDSGTYFVRELLILKYFGYLKDKSNAVEKGIKFVSFSPQKSWKVGEKRIKGVKEFIDNVEKERNEDWRMKLDRYVNGKIFSLLNSGSSVSVWLKGDKYWGKWAVEYAKIGQEYQKVGKKIITNVDEKKKAKNIVQMVGGKESVKYVANKFTEGSSVLGGSSKLSYITKGLGIPYVYFNRLVYVGHTGHDFYKYLRKEITMTQFWRNTVSNAGIVLGSSTGGYFGSIVGGSLGGAVIGSVVPVVGNTLGAFIGGIGGAIGGSYFGGKVGKKSAKYVLDTFSTDDGKILNEFLVIVSAVSIELCARYSISKEEIEDLQKLLKECIINQQCSRNKLREEYYRVDKDGGFVGNDTIRNYAENLITPCFKKILTKRK